MVSSQFWLRIITRGHDHLINFVFGPNYIMRDYLFAIICARIFLHDYLFETFPSRLFACVFSLCNKFLFWSQLYNARLFVRDYLFAIYCARKFFFMIICSKFSHRDYFLVYFCWRWGICLVLGIEWEIQHVDHIGTRSQWKRLKESDQLSYRAYSSAI